MPDCVQVGDPSLASDEDDTPGEKVVLHVVPHNAGETLQPLAG
jgi:hypothetical protein